ncbi:hypothetical protein Poli38472_006941 [Pythium oligandrum]|uniref:Cyclic nucleotide-binding domain-containing protein n=1 Tax=Pythium oligandrum TaxID=41045 RepID=A0A8K1C9D2_PYTOL|nr:hypothetical protein Poli38472_006941 [Pythium oligandrum]|eukprot:TMW58796.1 hypothetical protein Poli38472_006941 [Pythium oligandrum]
MLAGNRRSARIASELKLKEKTEAYESMMEHFQLRKLHRTFSADDGSRFSSPQSTSSMREQTPSEDQQVHQFRRTWPLDQGRGALDDSTCQDEYKGTTPLQNLFSTFSVLLGSVILAIVFGNVAMLVSNFNANSTNYQRKMEVVFATMNKLQLPHDLRERIHLYYDHLWQEYESLDGDIVKFSKELTHTLALEVGLYRYMNLIMKVPYWRECSPDFGEIGEEMYMVNRGLCEFADVTYSEDFSTARDQNHVGPTGMGSVLDTNEDEGIDQEQLHQLPRVVQSPSSPQSLKLRLQAIQDL